MALFFKRLTKRVRQPCVPAGSTALVKNSRGTRAGGQTGPRPRRLHAIPAYVLVVDESGSTSCTLRMASSRTTTRIKAIKLAGRKYLEQLAASNPTQLVAVVGFSDTANLYHPLAPVGRAMSGIYRALGSLHPQSMTNLSAGLSLALDQLARAQICRGNIVVITDGAANIGTERLTSLMNRARSRGVRIFTIGVGNLHDNDYDRDLLIRMARSTRGRFASAHTFTALCNALRRAC